MIEMLVQPSMVVKQPWKMFFVGLVYASLSIILVHLFFTNDPVLSEFSGVLVVTFSVMFSLPFIYYLLNSEEQQDEQATGILEVWKAHGDAIYVFLWLFVGFVVAFSFWNVMLQNDSLFNAQVGTYCAINNPGAVKECVSQYSFDTLAPKTGAATSGTHFLFILENNVYVMIFTLIFSLIFGAGAIFVLAWNASVIAAAIGIFTQYELIQIPLGLIRYLIHGIPEISAYFITALAGGMLGVSIHRHGVKHPLFIHVIQNVIILLFIALSILVLAAMVETYITPLFFS